MRISLNEIIDRKVYPIIIKNNGVSCLTLYYYNEKADSILHDPASLICFKDRSEPEAFCAENGLKINVDWEEIYTYDFDVSIENPVDYDGMLNRWNLLNTIAGIFGMYFEGNDRKYNDTYELLFRCCTPIEPIPPTVELSNYSIERLKKIFKKKNRFLDRFKYYGSEDMR